MTEIKIEKGIPIPEDGRKGRKQLYPFKDLQVGDSIYIEESKQANSCRVALGYYIRLNNLGWSVVSRQEGTGVRLWRTK